MKQRRKKKQPAPVTVRSSDAADTGPLFNADLVVAQTALVKVSDLCPRYDTREANPNKMDEEKYALLKRSMIEEGFLQPILVRHDGEQYVIEDGHHRWWAAKEIGLESISVIVKSMPDARARLLGIGMNRLRGDVDLSAAADIIRDVQAMLDLPMPEVSMLTGFSDEELRLLLQAEVQPEDLIEDAASDVTGDATSGQEFVLEIKFFDRDQYKNTKRKLRKLGKGDLAIGVLRALGDEEDSAAHKQDNEEEEGMMIE